MTEQIVAHTFDQGEWTYRAGETYSLEALAARGMSEADIAHWQRRGALAPDESAAQRDPTDAPDTDGPQAPEDEGVSIPPALGRDED